MADVDSSWPVGELSSYVSWAGENAGSWQGYCFRNPPSLLLEVSLHLCASNGSVPGCVIAPGRGWPCTQWDL